jgi:hypothetical protein
MELVKNHFLNYGNSYEHVCYPTFTKLFEEIYERGNPPLTIIETGTTAWGTSSTFLFDNYVNKYGGHFWSVDINPETTKNTQKNIISNNTTLVTNNSIDFLNEWVIKHPNKKADIIYLDSLDIVWNDPEESGVYGLKEYNAILPAIGKNTLLLIDDTPKDISYLNDGAFYFNKMGFMPGKGMYVIKENPNANILMHKYQILYKFN